MCLAGDCGRSRSRRGRRRSSSCCSFGEASSALPFVKFLAGLAVFAATVVAAAAATAAGEGQFEFSFAVVE